MSDMFIHTPPRSVTLSELPCPDCAKPRQMIPGTGNACCETSWCSAAGIAVPLWRLLERAGIDHNPVGTARPVYQGRPVPWTVPVTDSAAGLRAHWRALHRGRLAAAQQNWLCQHCGLAADSAAATVFVDHSGRCVVPAVLHLRCALDSAAGCPHLLRTSARAVTIARGEERRSGQVAPEIGLTEDWRLPTHLC